MVILCQKGVVSTCLGCSNDYDEDSCDNYKESSSGSRCCWRTAGTNFCVYNDVIEDGKIIPKRKEDD